MYNSFPADRDVCFWHPILTFPVVYRYAGGESPERSSSCRPGCHPAQQPGRAPEIGPPVRAYGGEIQGAQGLPLKGGVVYALFRTLCLSLALCSRVGSGLNQLRRFLETCTPWVGPVRRTYPSWHVRDVFFVRAPSILLTRERPLLFSR